VGESVGVVVVSGRGNPAVAGAAVFTLPHNSQVSLLYYGYNKDALSSHP
jgi:hypothetical protein